MAAVAASWSGLSTRPEGTAMVRYHHAHISIYIIIYIHTHCTYVYIIYRHTYHHYGQLQRLSDSVDARHHSPLPTVKLPWSGWPGYAPARLNHLPVGQVRVINSFQLLVKKKVSYAVLANLINTPGGTLRSLDKITEYSQHIGRPCCAAGPQPKEHPFSWASELVT